jgi:hypothetical protein
MLKLVAGAIVLFIFGGLVAGGSFVYLSLPNKSPISPSLSQQCQTATVASNANPISNRLLAYAEMGWSIEKITAWKDSLDPDDLAEAIALSQQVVTICERAMEAGKACMLEMVNGYDPKEDTNADRSTLPSCVSYGLENFSPP